MTRYVADDHIGGLTDFQRASVDHVINRFYKDGARRFLVADETGLGKTRVARGVIARSIEHLQDDDTVGRIDVVYICANADLAQQNLVKLNVTGLPERRFANRLTLLPLYANGLDEPTEGGRKRINLVSFTPGTSFDLGNTEGTAIERAVLYQAMCEIYALDGWGRRTALRIFQGGVRSLERFRRVYVDNWAAPALADGVHEPILDKFDEKLAAVDEDGWSLDDEWSSLLDDIGRRTELSPELDERRWRFVGALRAAMAQASVETLEPDLIIVDEFQRFTSLLRDDNEAGRLFHELCDYGNAKTLLLSATPFKPFTRAAEGESHDAGFLETLHTLELGNPTEDSDDERNFSTEKVRHGLTKFRDLLTLRDVGATSAVVDRHVVADVRRELLKVMSRSERPVVSVEPMNAECVAQAGQVTAADLVGYARLRAAAEAVATSTSHGLMSTEYWKSAPYFINFCDGYKLANRIKDLVDEGGDISELTSVLRKTQHLKDGELTAFKPVAPGNARMQTLVDQTLDRGWWKLLWVPPSLPYVTPEGPFAEADGMTKRLVFSSWNATPSAIASLLSYEADRRIAREETTVGGTKHSSYETYSPEGRTKVTRHLGYSLRSGSGEAASMSTFALFWPMQELAEWGDPLVHLSESGEPTTPEVLREAVKRLAAKELAVVDPTGDDHSAAPWRAAFSRPANWPIDCDLVQACEAMVGRAQSEDDENPEPPERGLTAIEVHIREAQAIRDGGGETPSSGDIEALADLALFAPASIAWRVLDRLVSPRSAVTSVGHFLAAATLANGVRSVFNRPEAVVLLEKLYPEERFHWQRVLRYCAAGNLEAVLDEYLFHLRADVVSGEVNDDSLKRLAREAASAMTMRAARYPARGAAPGDEAIAFSARFALRYAGRNTKEDSARPGEVRHAFNSPFWPFVLASTSVGQEGIDFHWWSHAVFHWNLPSNPVDFEQREGRVDRYRGHAVRKNVAAAHGRAGLCALASGKRSTHLWDELYARATDYRDEFGDFTPGWVFPGPAKIERHLAPYAFTREGERYERMKEDVALYRLTFGQPRQEDLLEALQRRASDGEDMEVLRIDLRPGCDET